MPPDGYPAFLQYLQFVRVRTFLDMHRAPFHPDLSFESVQLSHFAARPPDEFVI